MSTQLEPEIWLRDYAILALRVNKSLTKSTGGTVLIYRGAAEWSAQVEDEAPRPPAELIEDCAHLLREMPFVGTRAAHLSGQLRAMRAMVGGADGARPPLEEYARQCLGVAATWQPETVFAVAHDQLDGALPAGGSLAARLHRWQQTYTLPPDRSDRLPELVHRAIAETRARTEAIVPLPADTAVECVLDPGPHRGHYQGGRRATLYICDSVPVNLADLLYVVAHEGFPGHIAESMLKEIHLVEGAGLPEHQVRFMISPSFVLSEGLGLHAQEIVFPGDEAQRWLTDNILSPLGICPDGSDFAAIHDARNVLWGAWGNAAFLAAEGRPDAEIVDYLTRWALVTDAEARWAVDFVRTPGMNVYVLGYYHGWRLLRPWLDHPERAARVRRLLTEPVLLTELDDDPDRQ
ncbi:hypothetical protein [Plantactinospora sp. KLBMP9567]|uniref:hypothetical protein n=1 Tax=Plantactinospora sp. KLBMP9567 TaxID=3085900 RepID=UPI00298125C7|nr:hypothetical protein [Plantactinospora sp. KLBMP9567]MDW5325434.1 hypothetical protein [Plantactinospora sp. KLBMP9567]